MTSTTTATTVSGTTVANTTHLVTTNEPESQNTSSTIETTLTPTKQQTTSSLISSTTNATTEKQSTTDGGSAGDDTMAIVGGCIGGLIVVVLVVVLIVFLFIRRRKKRRNSGNVPVLPDKDFIDSIQVDHAVRFHRETQAKEEPEDPATKHYVNLTSQGETDEQTDPSVGPDGYLKKTRNFLHIGKHKHQKHRKGHQNGKKNKKHVTEVDNSNHSPIYTNEISTSKEPAKRSDSMPVSPAPPIPRNSAGYIEGRVADKKEDAINDDAMYRAGYANLQGQKKGEPAVSIPNKTNANYMNEQNDRRKLQSHVTTKDSPKSNSNKNKHFGNQESEDKKVYENVTGGNYYNLKANEKVELQRQSTYEEVGKDSYLHQDDVYENP